VTKRIVISLLKYALGIGLLGYLIWSNWAPAGGAGLSAVWQKHVIERAPVNVGAYALGLLASMIAVLITFVRWYILVRAQGLPFTLTNALRLGMVGYFCNTFLPGSVGGDLVKATFIAREQSRRTVAVATVLIDRAVGLWGLCWLVAIVGSFGWLTGLLAGPAERVLQSISATAVGIVAGSLVVWVLLGLLPNRRADRFARRLEGIPGVGHSAAEFWRAVWMYRRESRSVWLALGLALVGHVFFVLSFYLAALTLQDSVDVPSLVGHFLIVPIGMAIQAGIPLPGGIGGGELVFSKLYRLIDYPESNGFLMSLVYRCGFTWILGLTGYLVYLQMRPSLAEEPASADTDSEAAACAS
jgi:glycosyltransferase 2 family protein